MPRARKHNPGSVFRKNRLFRGYATLGDFHVRIHENGDRCEADAKKPREFMLTVEYHGYSREVDQRLFKLVGRTSDGSGCFMAGPERGLRDHVWYFTVRAKAVGAARRLKGAGKAIPKLRVELTGPLEI